jgi:hypothetical protein
MAKTFKIFNGPHFEDVTKDLSNTLKCEISEAFPDSLDPTESESLSSPSFQNIGSNRLF